MIFRRESQTMAELAPATTDHRAGSDGAPAEITDWEPLVLLLYHACLGRKADEGGLQSFVSSLAAKSITAQQMIDELQRSDEGAAFAQTIAHGRLVSALYNGILRRPPEPRELAHWRAALDNGLPLTSMIQEVEVSLEAQREQLERIIASRGVTAVLLAEVDHLKADQNG